ncbi:glycosyltransferase family 2 protein [Cryobacterium zhongshanensis]|uniref:Glycosyltransferase family 2 protein n=1 Tax=Cryobacterium zhongshanensis TaxID=2928153 RepID=A0AA41QYR4_9MICO|nr:glycosyltransferase family 2 protein [Cryobacterium zhongshanensis]MCI4658396.1 glycosyltransferase family 2 protein [Cryobacterium zhongshanensis]
MISDRSTGSADTTSPRVAVVTVSYNSHDVLDEFFQTLTKATDETILRLLVDNKPRTDSATERIAGSFGARYLSMGSNRGYGAAVNFAARTLPASIDWILICNPDLTFEETSLDTLVRRGDAEPDAGAIGPAIHTESGEVYPSARAIPSLRTGIGHALLSEVWPANPWTAAYRHDSTTDSGSVGWLSGACLLVRRSAFDRIGGFDEGFFMYFEDVDLGYRLGKAGFANIYEPRAVVVHSGAHSTSAHASRMLTAHHESAKRFLSKKYPGWFFWPMRLALKLGLDARVRYLDRRSRKANT